MNFYHGILNKEVPGNCFTLEEGSINNRLYSNMTDVAMVSADMQRVFCMNTVNAEKNS